MGSAGLEILLALGTRIIHYDGLQRFDTEALDLDVLAKSQAATMKRQVTIPAQEERDSGQRVISRRTGRAIPPS